MKKWFFLFLVFFSGCAPTNLSDLRCEGASEIKKLTAELKKIEKKEDADKAFKKLRNHFNRIGDLLIETRKYSDSDESLHEATMAGEELFIELARLYEIPGVRSVIEAAQDDAVRELDRLAHGSRIKTNTRMN